MLLKHKCLWFIMMSIAATGTSSAQDLPFGISLPPSLNFATSPTPVGSGARAAGKGFAFIGVADDATAASWNPGGLVQLERPEASVVGSYFVRVEDQDVNQPDIIVDDQTIRNGNLNYMSGVYPFELFHRNIVLSLNYQRLLDLEGKADVISRFDTIDGVQEVNSDQDGGLFTISPAVAFQITPSFSAGIAFNFWPDIFGNGWEQDVDVQAEGRVISGNRIVPFLSDGHIDEDYDFEGFNFTFGMLWKINRIFTLGGVFRSPFTADVTHKHSSKLTVSLQDGSAPVTTRDKFTESLDMDMPLSYGVGIAARLSDRVTLSFDVSRVHWSDFELEESSRDVLQVENGAPSGKSRAVLAGESDDTTAVRLGGEYLWIKPKFVVPFRAGLFYDPEPGDNDTDDFFGFSLGSGVAVNRFIFDVAYTFRYGEEESEATDTTVYENKIFASAIFHF